MDDLEGLMQISWLREEALAARGRNPRQHRQAAQFGHMASTYVLLL